MSRRVIAYYGLIRASDPTRRLMVVLRPAGIVGDRGSQLSVACPCFRAVCLTPADSAATCRELPPTGAFAVYRTSRHPRLRAKIGSRPALLSRLHSSLDAAARKLAGPSPTRAFTFELSSHESPHWNVEYHYAGQQPIPAAGLTPAGQATLLAAPALKRGSRRGLRSARSPASGRGWSTSPLARSRNIEQVVRREMR